MCSMFILSLLVSLAACSAKIESSGGGSGGGGGGPSGEQAGETAPTKIESVPANAAGEAHFIYCYGNGYELAMDMGTRTLQSQPLYPSHVRVAVRAVTQPEISFEGFGLQSIMQISFDGKENFALSSSKVVDGHHLAFNYRTATFLTGEMEFTNDNNSFTHLMTCKSYHTNHWNGSALWPKTFN